MKSPAAAAAVASYNKHSGEASVQTSSDGDIQTIRSMGFSFGAPSSVSSSTQIRDQQRFTHSLGGMQEPLTNEPHTRHVDIEVGLTSGRTPTRSMVTTKQTKKNTPSPGTRSSNPPRQPKLKNGEIQSLASNSSSDSVSIQTTPSSTKSLIFKGMFRFRNNDTAPATDGASSIGGISTASPPMTLEQQQQDIPILHSLLNQTKNAISQDEENSTSSPLAKSNKRSLPTRKTESTSPRKKNTPYFASSQSLLRRRSEGTASSAAPTTTTTADKKVGSSSIRHRRPPQAMPDDASSSPSEKESYDLNPLPIHQSTKHDDAFHIAALDTRTRDQVLDDCYISTPTASDNGSKASFPSTFEPEEGIEASMIDSLEAEIDTNSKQASLDYYNVPTRQSPPPFRTTDPQRQQQPPGSFLTTSTKNTASPSVAAEMGSKNDDIQTIEIGITSKEQGPHGLVILPESRKTPPRIPFVLPNPTEGRKTPPRISFILPSPTQSTGAPTSDDDEQDNPYFKSNELTTRSSDENDISSGAEVASLDTTGGDSQFVRDALQRSVSDKDPASFDFSVHGNFTYTGSGQTNSLDSLDLAMERGRTMAIKAQESFSDDSRRQQLGADIPIAIRAPPPVSVKVLPSEKISPIEKIPRSAKEPLPAPKINNRKRDRCICIWVVLLCTLVMLGAIASAMCGLGKCEPLNRLLSGKSTSSEIQNGQEETIRDTASPIGPPPVPPNHPLTVRDPPLPTDTILPVTPTARLTTMPTFSPSRPFIRSTALPTKEPFVSAGQEMTGLPSLRPIPVPTTWPPTRAPQTFPVFSLPTNTPMSGSPIRNPTLSLPSDPTRSPTLRPISRPLIITLPTLSPRAASSGRAFSVSTNGALLAAIDAYLDGNIGFPISDWDVSQVTDFSLAFSASRNPKAASFNEDLTNWDTSRAVSMRRMFLDADSFDGDVSNFDTSNVLDMQEMFGRAESFTGDISRWDVSKVTTMAGMFRRAANFNSDISRWDTGSVLDMSNMFLNCASFNQDLSTWNVSSVKNFAGMFRSAVSFNSDLRWNTQEASDMATMFMAASSFNGDVSSFSTSTITSMDKMFYYASSFEGKGLENWDTSSVVVFDRMFAGTISFPGDGLSNWNVGNARFMDKMFAGATLFSQNLCDWRELLSPMLDGQVNHMFINTSCPRTDDPLPTSPGQSAMCFACSGSLLAASPLVEIPLREGSTGISFSSRAELQAAVDSYLVDRSSTLQYGFPIGNWDVSRIRDFSSLFSTVRNPEMVTFDSDLSNWNTTSATDTSSMFEGAISFTDAANGLANWNMANVRDMHSMFAYSAFVGDVSRWDVSNVENFDSMFTFALSFSGDTSNWNVSSGKSFGWMFRGAVRFNSDLSKWSVTSSVDFTHMFAGARLYNANLCGWSSLVGDQIDTRGMFSATSCPSTLDPSLVGSWCYQC